VIYTRELTARGIAAIKAPATGTDIYRDTKERGLELWVGKTGRMTWVFRYSATVAGKRVFPRLTLPVTSLADAREKADLGRRAVQHGEDPGAAMGLTKVPASARPAAPPPVVGVDVAAPTRKLLGFTDDQVIPAGSFGALAALWLVHYAQQKKITWRDDADDLKSYVLPYWWDTPARSIGRAEVHARLDAIAERGSERKGPKPAPTPNPDGTIRLAAPVKANRILSLISGVFNLGLDRAWIDHHPAYRIGKRTETPRDRWLKKDEVLTLWDACDNDPDPVCAAALLFQLFTAQRGTMIVEAEWPEVALDEPWWTVPLERVKNRKGPHRVPLGPLSLELLDKLRTSGLHGQYLFPHRGWSKASGFFDRLYDVLERARTPLTSVAIAQTLVATGLPLPARPRAHLPLRVSQECSRQAKQPNPFVMRTPDGWALTDRTRRPLLGDGPLTLRTSSWRAFTARICRAIGFLPHDLRHTMTTHLSSLKGPLKVPSDNSGKILSHSTAKSRRSITERVYDHWEYDDVKMEAMLRWHDLLMQWRGLAAVESQEPRVIAFPRP